MITRTLAIRNKLGLHARAATVFIKTAGRFSSTVSVKNHVREADGKSIMAMMMLQASFGSEIIVSTEGEDEAEAMSAIEHLVENRFGEDD